MSHDVIALVRGAPDVRAAVAALAAGGGLRMQEGADQTLRLSAPGGAQVSVEAPQPVRVAGEVERLLGAQVAAQVPIPLWWVEARAGAGNASAAELARRVADELVRRFGGVVWEPPRRDRAKPSAAPAPGPAEQGGGDAVIPGPAAPAAGRDTSEELPVIGGHDFGARGPGARDLGPGDIAAGDLAAAPVPVAVPAPDLGVPDFGADQGQAPQRPAPLGLGDLGPGPATGPQLPVAGTARPFGADPVGESDR